MAIIVFSVVAENSMTKYQPLGTMERYRSSAVFMELRL
jgi:hypothetical protein